MKTLLPILLLVIPFLCLAEERLTPQGALTGFPLCAISSSYGQRCKVFSDKEKAAFTPSQIEEITDIEIDTDTDTLNITTEDWMYSFSINNAGANQVTLMFTDDAKFVTYFTSTEFDIRWDENQKNWFILGEETDYIGGSAENKDNEGKYISYSKPIPFYQKN
jgi:hypothetical protein